MGSMTRKVPLLTLLSLVLTLALPSAAAAQGNGHGHGVLQRYARDTWASFVAMTDPMQLPE